MIEYEPQAIIQKLDSMPRVVRNYVHDPATGENIRAIGQRHGLLLDQIAALVDETIWVMIGLTPQTAFKDRIKERFVLSDERAQAVTKEIADTIVEPILNELKAGTAPAAAVDTDTITDAEINALVSERIPGIDFDIKEENTGLRDSGIEVLDTSAERAAPAITMDRDALLHHVENPNLPQRIPAPEIAADEVARGITGEKLAGNFKIPAEQKDYSINKNANVAAPAETIIRHRDRVDPYREEVEL